MIYFEIRPNTKEFASAERIYNWKEPWQTDEIMNEFKDALGIDPEGNLCIDTYQLRMKTIPEGTRDQFKKQRSKEGHCLGLAKSELNQKYLSIIRKHNLTTYGMFEFSIQFGFDIIHSLNPITNPDKSHRFFISTKKGIEQSDINKLRKNPCLSEIPEYEFLILKATMLKDIAEKDAQEQASKSMSSD